MVRNCELVGMKQSENFLSISSLKTMGTKRPEARTGKTHKFRSLRVFYADSCNKHYKNFSSVLKRFIPESWLYFLFLTQKMSSKGFCWVMGAQEDWLFGQEIRFVILRRLNTSFIGILFIKQPLNISGSMTLLSQYL